MRLPSLNDFLLNEQSTKGFVYDIESFPNFFCVTFYNGKQYIQFRVGFGENQIDNLLSFIDGKVLIGYNNYSFDDLVLNYIVEEKNKLLDSSNPAFEISKIVSKIIHSHNSQSNNDDEYLKFLKFGKKKYHSIDLMRVMFFKKGLKLLAIALKHGRIQDLPLSPTEDISKENSELILDYNKNDVDITYKLLAHVRGQIEMRYDMSIEYDMFLMNDRDSTIASKVLQKLYQQRFDKGIDFKSLKTESGDIHLNDVIFDVVKFKSEKVQLFLEKLKSITLLKSKDYNYKYPKLSFFNKTYVFGGGGLHSEDTASQFISGDKLIIDSDVASYYPSMVISYKIKPRHLDDVFVDILDDIKQRRIKYKRSGEKVRSEGLKVVINSIVGKIMVESEFTYDQFAYYQVVVNGQLFLMMLIEEMELNGIEVISANTDGIVCLVKKDMEHIHKKICDDWSKKMLFELEHTYYNKYVRRDVNNYITIDTDEKVKSKGVFLQKINLQAGYNHPVVQKCLYEYFINGKDYKECLKNHSDILDFCMSQKVGSQFDDVVWGGQSVQKSVRFYASTNGKKLYKIKGEAKHDLCSGRLVQVFNDFEESNDYHIDYDFYNKEIEKIISEIEEVKSYQEALF